MQATVVRRNTTDRMNGAAARNLEKVEMGWYSSVVVAATIPAARCTLSEV